jgi:hypothetical protein
MNILKNLVLRPIFKPCKVIKPMTYKLIAKCFLEVFNFTERFKPITFKIINESDLPDVEFEFDSNGNIDLNINAINQI